MKYRLSTIFRFFFLLWIVSEVGVSYSAGKQVVIVASKPSAMYIEIVDVVESVLRQRFSAELDVHRTDLTMLASLDPPIDWNKFDLAISVGTNAADFLASKDNGLQRLQIFIPKSAAVKILEQAPAAVRDRSVSIYLDQPFSRELNLTKSLIKQVDSVGVLIGPLSQSIKSELSQLGKDAGVHLFYAEVDEADNGYANIRTLFSKTEAILTIPDPIALSSHRAKWLLYQSYQKKVPIISFSQSLVSAGALAAVYSSTAQIGQQAGELASEILHAQIPKRRFFYPKYFDVAINRAVARSLGLEVNDEETLVKSIRGLEHVDD